MLRLTSSKINIVCKVCTVKEKIFIYDLTQDEINQGFTCPNCSIRDSKIYTQQLEKIVMSRKATIQDSNIICCNKHSFSKFIKIIIHIFYTQQVYSLEFPTYCNLRCILCIYDQRAADHPRMVPAKAMETILLSKRNGGCLFAGLFGLAERSYRQR